MTTQDWWDAGIAIGLLLVAVVVAFLVIWGIQ